jgi:NAD(P)H-dependent FMN reductase
MNTTLITSTLQPRLRIGEIARATHRHLRATSAAVTTVETDNLPQSALMAGAQHPALLHAHEVIDTAESLVIVTPRYESDGSVALRTLLSDLPAQNLRGKLVLAIGLGAIRSQASGLTRVARPEGANTLSGCFLYDTWLENCLGHWRLTHEANRHLAQAIEALAAATDPRSHRLAC